MHAPVSQVMHMTCVDGKPYSAPTTCSSTVTFLETCPGRGSCLECRYNVNLV